MTSTCSRSAASATRATSAARFAKSAARIEGATFILRRLCVRSARVAHEAEDEHAVGPGVGGEQDGAATVRPPRRHRPRRRGEVEEVGARPLVDTDRLLVREGANGVDEGAAGPDGTRRRAEELALQGCKLAHVRRLDAPTRVGPAPQHAEAAARRVEQNAVERAVVYGERSAVR